MQLVRTHNGPAGLGSPGFLKERHDNSQVGSRRADANAARYPIHRYVSCAACGTLQSLIDDLALEMGLCAQRLDIGSLLLDGPGVFIQVTLAH
jgi:hypothetical protein